eukprot:TRINITY_DN1856_c0_g1_i2.p1 TRINITY_DN1856_c0_g1~~TRINITY_DN1856_c0_g1_i2.p1  ORF type:complete len:267 (-),score=29.90 TRINITY_DN1856_c0_g1_i2:131-862(-)
MIACQNRGIWTKIEDGGNLQDTMGSYYSYLSSLYSSQTGIVYVEPYVDASGAGPVLTVSKSFYDGPSLLGVVGLDLKMSDILEIEPDYQSLLSVLIGRSKGCPKFEPTECMLENMRKSSYTFLGMPTSVCNTSLNCFEDYNLISCLNPYQNKNYCSINKQNQTECCNCTLPLSSKVTTTTSPSSSPVPSSSIDIPSIVMVPLGVLIVLSLFSLLFVIVAAYLFNWKLCDSVHHAVQNNNAKNT